MTNSQLIEAADRGVVIYDRPPTPAQWVRIRQDLDCEPKGGRWWRARKWGCSLVVVKGLLTTHPAYAAIPEAVAWAGAANPVPVISADLSYPEPGGHGGVSVALHECGHALCDVLTTHGQERLKDRPVWSRNDYYEVHKLMLPVRVDRQPNDSPAEYWAQDYACWCLWTARRDDRAPWFAGPDYFPVRRYFKALLYSAGFRWTERAE